MEKTTLYIEEDIKCTYYPATHNMCIENELTGECIVLNYSRWAKVYEWFRAVTRNREG